MIFVCGEDACFFPLTLSGFMTYFCGGSVIFLLVERLCDFFCVERFRDFFVERLHDFFVERLRDFLLLRECTIAEKIKKNSQK